MFTSSIADRSLKAGQYIITIFKKGDFFFADKEKVTRIDPLPPAVTFHLTEEIFNVSANTKGP